MYNTHPLFVHPFFPRSVYTMQLMLECKHYVCERLPSREMRKSLNYTELGRQAMGTFGKWAVDISVLGCNLGVCAGYMIFIAGNLHVRVYCIHITDSKFLDKLFYTNEPTDKTFNFF